MIVMISWRSNNNRQQGFDLMEMHYINPIIIIIHLVFNGSQLAKMNKWIPHMSLP